MRKKVIIYSIVIILLVIAIIFFINNKTIGKQENINEKAISEIEYLESKLTDSLNILQNINLEQNQIDDGEINWENLKQNIQEIYTSIPTITLDLYSIGIDQNEILNFNKDLDVALDSINNEEKVETGEILAKLYAYLPKYIEMISSDTKYINTIKTKSNIFIAYGLLESEKWDEILSYTKLAIENFALVLGDSINDENEYLINKCYIELNELINSIDSKSKETFLIKYMNLVEDLGNL